MQGEQRLLSLVFYWIRGNIMLPIILVLSLLSALCWKRSASPRGQELTVGPWQDHWSTRRMEKWHWLQQSKLMPTPIRRLISWLANANMFNISALVAPVVVVKIISWGWWDRNAFDLETLLDSNKHNSSSNINYELQYHLSTPISSMNTTMNYELLNELCKNLRLF